MGKRDKKYVERKLELAAKFGRVCFYCEVEKELEDLVIDHIVARSIGGKNSLDNYYLACIRCNASKWAQPLSEWLEKNIGYMEAAKTEYDYRRSIVNKLRKVLDR